MIGRRREAVRSAERSAGGPGQHPSGAALRAFVAVLTLYSAELAARAVTGRGIEDWIPIAVGTGVAAALAALLAWLLSRLLGPLLAAGAASAAALLPLAGDLADALGDRWGGTAGAGELLARVALAVALGGTLVAVLKRPVARTIAAVVTALCLVVAAVSERPPGRSAPLAQAGSSPDVILLVLDTTRPDRLSLYGHDRPTSPHLDRLAEAAQVYEDAWSVAPWTAPSHASLFTGLLPAEHGVDGRSRPPLPADIATLPQLLHNAGYRTAGFPANPQLVDPTWARGFDAYRPPWFRGSHSLVPILNRWARGTTDDWRLGSTEEVLEMARRWWAEAGDAPRFLFLNVLDPHYPYRPPESAFDRFLPDTAPDEAYAVEQSEFHYILEPGVGRRERELLGRLYDAEIAEMDRLLGRFFDWLEARDDLDDTVIVVTSDHGERLGERGLVGHDLLLDPYVLRVPLIVRYPPRLPPARIEGRVQLNGLPGTVAVLVGVEPPTGMAADFLEPRADRVVVAQYQHAGWILEHLTARSPDFDVARYDGDWLFATDGRFAYVASQGGADVERLFDLEGDPEMREDVAVDHPEVIERLRDVVAALPRFGAVADTELDADTLERLRALGYLD